jgi:rhodanese-related sulfurtransferase
MQTATQARPGIREASPAEVKAWIDSGSAALVDVREPDERAGEWIPGSTSMPLSRFDAAALPRADRIVFHCAGGLRSPEAAARAAGRDGLYSLAGGLNAWKSAGLPTERNARVPISIMRQVQITAGLIVLVFSVLAVAVSAWFALGAAFIGAGLTFAGASGTCGMAAMLRLMPWNAAMRVDRRS